ncbi:MAG TPA: glycosyltransferase family 39 protein [Candidatus Limnocylindria bacterium]|nr:glycosyltransferase family 39 protein [Candidatus Limnocylindria bacterium]
MRRVGLRELTIVLAILGIGWTLRWWHLGTPSLWWDEMVQLSFAGASDLWQVYRNVQTGVPPGSGNAGAVPLDYVLLHAWTWLVGRPPLELLEAYYRFPSYVWSCVGLIAFWAYVRTAFGALAGAAAALLLGLSLPHVLYAAEARFYSLMMLMSVLNLAAFTQVMRRPERATAWVACGLVNVAFFLTGMLSALVLPWQYAALVLRVLFERSERSLAHRLALPAATLLLLTAAVGLYYARVDVGARGIRPGTGLLSVQSIARDALEFVTLGDRRQLALYAVGVLVAPWYCLRRRRELLPVVATMLVAVLASVPLLLELLQWKRYYFHPRHLLFLLPTIELLAALGLCGTVEAVLQLTPLVGRRHWTPWLAAAVALALVLAVRLPVVRSFMARPHPYFARIKTDRDMKGLVRDLRARTAFYGPEDRYLLLADRIGPGYLGNPTLAKYLQWYALDKRVLLAGTTDMPDVVGELLTACDGPCRGRPVEEVARRLHLGSPFDVSLPKLRLLGIPARSGLGAGVVRDVGLVVYAGSRRLPDFSSTDVWAYTGVFVAEPRWRLAERPPAPGAR